MLNEPIFLVLSNEGQLDFFETCEKLTGFQASISDRWATSLDTFHLKPIMPIEFKGQLQSGLNPLWFNKKFENDFHHIAQTIKSNELSKAVAFNTLELDLSFDPLKVLNAYNGDHHFYGLWNSSEGMIGLSPELLFSKNSSSYTIDAVAGTASSKDLWDEKYIAEHSFVEDSITSELNNKKIKYKLKEREILKYGDFSHWKSQISFLNNELNDEELVELLQPTAAIGYYPRNKYIGLKNKIEFEKNKANRFYGGCLSLQSANFSKSIVMIRAISWSGDKTFIHAGCGITKDSKFEIELEESLRKIKKVGDMFGIKF